MVTLTYTATGTPGGAFTGLSAGSGTVVVNPVWMTTTQVAIDRAGTVTVYTFETAANSVTLHAPFSFTDVTRFPGY